MRLAQTPAAGIGRGALRLAGRRARLAESRARLARSRAQPPARPPRAKSLYDVVIFDMDGVITDTAIVHAAAWKALFDKVLQSELLTGEVLVRLLPGPRDQRRPALAASARPARARRGRLYISYRDPPVRIEVTAMTARLSLCAGVAVAITVVVDGQEAVLAPGVTREFRLGGGAARPYSGDAVAP